MARILRIFADKAFYVPVTEPGKFSSTSDFIELSMDLAGTHNIGAIEAERSNYGVRSVASKLSCGGPQSSTIIYKIFDTDHCPMLQQGDEEVNCKCLLLLGGVVAEFEQGFFGH